MAGNRPLSREDFAEYLSERNRINKERATHKKTYKVMYKSLCPACAHNATFSKKIIYDCPNCKRRYWNNCSPKQVTSGVILQKLESLYGNIEWVKAFKDDGTEVYSWRKHDSTYEQKITGRWEPKN